MVKNNAAHVPGAGLAEGVRPANDDLHPFLGFLFKNWKTLAAGLAALLVVLAAIGFYNSYQKNRVAALQEEIGAVLAAKDGAERLAALEKILADAPAAARDGVLLEIAQTAENMKDFAKAAQAWEQVAQATSNPVKTVALLGQASALTQSGDNQKALELLEKIEKDAPKTFAMIVTRQMAVTAEALGDNQKAVGCYERLLAEGNLPNKSYLEAKIEELKAKPQKGAQGNS